MDLIFFFLNDHHINIFLKSSGHEELFFLGFSGKFLVRFCKEKDREKVGEAFSSLASVLRILNG